MKNSANAFCCQSSLNTLAQSGTGNTTVSTAKEVQIVFGEGTALSNEHAIKGRAKRKLITDTMVLILLKIADQKKDFERIQSYWNTYHCQRTVYSHEGKLYGRYCKNRFCTLCCSIRKAQIMNRYLPIIQTWEEPYFITLTAKSVKANILHKRMKKLNLGFARIIGKHRKRAQRGKGIKLMGIKSLECNFNPIKKTYNPHFHIIVPNEATADILIDEWLSRCTKDYASPKGQDKQRIHNRETALIEVVKYGSKIFTEPDVNNKSKQKKGDRDIYAAALDNIFYALKGRRIFDRFGFDLPKETYSKEGRSMLINEYQEWTFDLKQADWINTSSECALSDFQPITELLNLLQYHINTDLE